MKKDFLIPLIVFIILFITGSYLQAYLDYEIRLGAAVLILSFILFVYGMFV